jgi:hypothetical protein
MPVISYFFGIYIRMYHDDHNPPHFHAEYQGHEGLFAIEDGAMLAGNMPRKAQKIIAEWATEHRDALMVDWELAVAMEPLERIQGADND